MRGLTRQQVLCPLESVPIIIGIGLNYRVHAEEAKVRDCHTNYGTVDL